jgi:hypothetical protein
VEFGVDAVCESGGVQVLGVEEEESIFHPGCRLRVCSKRESRPRAATWRRTRGGTCVSVECAARLPCDGAFPVAPLHSPWDTVYRVK